MGGASSLSWYKKGETPTLSTPEEEKDVTPGDAEIPDSIAKALLDALQEELIGNSLPPTVIPMARIRAAQLTQCLMTGREPSDNTVTGDVGAYLAGARGTRSG